MSVCLSTRTHLPDIISIKKINRLFGRGGVARHALREVTIQRHLSMCDNSAVLLDFDATFVEYGEIYLIMAPSEANLAQIIRSQQHLSNAHLQYFAVQLLRGVRYMHAAHIVHRDLKPSNLLVNADCSLRICDYGLARAWSEPPHAFPPTSPETDLSKDQDQDKGKDKDKSFGPLGVFPMRATHSDEDHSSPLRKATGTPRSSRPIQAKHLASGSRQARNHHQQTKLLFPGEPLSGHVATRWYRAPEVFLQSKDGYGPEMDMWAVGCILAELMLGRPLLPGSNFADQLRRIHHVLGSPPQTMYSRTLSSSARRCLASLDQRPPIDWGELFPPDCDPTAVDLVSKLLRWNPDDRLTAAQALNHPWLSAYRSFSQQWTSPPAYQSFGQVEFTSRRSGFVAGFQAVQEAMYAEWAALLSHALSADSSSNSGSTPLPSPPTSLSSSSEEDEEEGEDKSSPFHHTQPSTGGKPTGRRVPPTHPHPQLASATILAVSPSSTECATSVTTPLDEGRPNHAAHAGVVLDGRPQEKDSEPSLPVGDGPVADSPSGSSTVTSGTAMAKRKDSASVPSRITQAAMTRCFRHAAPMELRMKSTGPKPEDSKDPLLAAANPHVHEDLPDEPGTQEHGLEVLGSGAMCNLWGDL